MELNNATPITTPDPKTLTRAQALPVWLKLGDVHGGQNFLPDNGYCFSCRRDLVEYWQKTLDFSSTGCRLCCASFCD